MKKAVAAAAACAALTLPYGLKAQTACRGGTLTGVVEDETRAVLPGAPVVLDGTEHATSAGNGQFRFGCVSPGEHRVTATAPGFADATLRISMPKSGLIEFLLKPAEVVVQTEVDAEQDSAAVSAASTGATQTISGSELQSLADDPDDLLRQVQQLGAALGAAPANVTIAVDGFQGSSELPPKSSIAYIKVNPDMFSTEYREPPFDGARVEVYTKPGQKAYHGALFATNGSPWENARDPFSTSRAALGKQRYGFELTGPVRKTGSDFALTLEHRSIDNFAVVNAFTLDSSGNEVNTVENVATPQRLWLGTARLDWQAGTKNTIIASYSANVNHRANLGVGGAVLAEAGYDSVKYEHMARLSVVTLADAHLMHEGRVSLRWDGENDVPVSTAPQVQVAGAFTSGGASLGPQQIHEFNLEWDDDAILTTKSHTLKFGTQMQAYDEHRSLPTNFNGTYVFGGGTAPVLDGSGNPVLGRTETITGIEQYRRAQLGLAGGTPTAFSRVAGNPQVNFTQIQNSLFFEDDWNVGHNVKLSYGVRWFAQTNPAMLDSLVPRFGVLWSPDKRGRWTLHAHAGMFSGEYGPNGEAEVLREDGVHRVTSLIYNPVYGNPFAGATPIYAMRTYAPGLTNESWAAENIGGTRALPFGFNLSLDYYLARIWNASRSNNINAPLNGDPYGPRPGAPDTDILQVQNSGQGGATATFVSVEQHSLKHAQFVFGGVRVKLVDDTDDDEFFTPQSAFSDAGEVAPRTGQGVWQLFGTGTFTFPEKLQVSADFHGMGDRHYNITTGFDNNGDGDFNDRPQYAAPGTPGAVQTRYGLLVASGGTGVFPRNRGVMPWAHYLDLNVQRTFTVTRDTKAEHQQKVTLNVRSSNVLNHVNVMSVDGVLGSPQFGLPVTADNGRRVEAGVRYSF